MRKGRPGDGRPYRIPSRKPVSVTVPEVLRLGTRREAVTGRCPGEVLYGGVRTEGRLGNCVHPHHPLEVVTGIRLIARGSYPTTGVFLPGAGEVSPPRNPCSRSQSEPTDRQFTPKRWV